jgi:nucleotide-binding universal stress UspA family protein
MNCKKVIVAVSLEAETHAPLMKLKNMGIDRGAEIHLVHIVPIIVYGRGIHLSVMTYPLPEERPKVEEIILANLGEVKNELFPDYEKVILKCLFDSNEKSAFSDYVDQNKADLVVVATRPKHGLFNFFDSSFAQHQLKHASTDVLVLR